MLNPYRECGALCGFKWIGLAERSGVRWGAGRSLKRNLLDRKEESRKRIPGQVDEKEGQRSEERERCLAMLDPEADGAAVRVDQFIFGIGVKEGEAGEEEKIENKTHGEEREGLSILFEDFWKHRIQK